MLKSWKFITRHKLRNLILPPSLQAGTPERETEGRKCPSYLSSGGSGGRSALLKCNSLLSKS